MTSRRPARSLLQLLACLALLATASVGSSHATLVIGNVQLNPDPPVAGTPFTLTVRLEDTLLTPVEKAHVRVELRFDDPAGPPVPESAIGSEASEFLTLSPVAASERFVETATRGTYSGTITAPDAGEYVLSIRDTTFLNEEAIANIRLHVDGAPHGSMAFVLPPTPIAPRSLSTWLIWLVGIPLAAAAVTTVLVLRKPAGTDEPKEGGA